MEPRGVHLRFARPSKSYTGGSGVFAVMGPCTYFLRLYSIRLKRQEKNPSCTWFEWFFRIGMWMALIAYGIVGVLNFYTLIIRMRKGTTLLSSEGLHSVFAYETTIILLTGVLSNRRRRHLNDYMSRLEKYTRAAELQMSRCHTVVFYVLLTTLFVHSVCLVFTTGMLQYKVVAPEDKLSPIESDNDTSPTKGQGQNPSAVIPQVGGTKGSGINALLDTDGNLGPGKGGGLTGTMDNVNVGEGDMSGLLGVNPMADLMGELSTGDVGGDEDDADFNRRRSRKRRDALRHSNGVAELTHPVSMVEMTIVAEKVEERESEQTKFDVTQEGLDETTAVAASHPDKPPMVSVGSGRGLLRVRRGLIDTAIDDSTDKDDINFIEIFKPFLPIFNVVRYLIVRNLIYVSVTLISSFCVVIQRRLAQINRQLVYKIKLSEVSSEVLAEIRQAYSQCITLLRDIERNFSFFCFLWNLLVLLETLYIGRMLYEVNATDLYDLPSSNVGLWMAFYNTVIVLDLVLIVAFQTILTETATSVRLQALGTIDVVTIGTASIPPNRIEAHQQAELLMTLATIQDPGLTAWDIAAHSRALGYSIIVTAYLVLFAYIQFLRDGRWRRVFGTIMQKQETTTIKSDSADELNIGGDLGMDLDGHLPIPTF